nr:hypothetical protein [Novosphingobium sp. THN1]
MLVEALGKGFGEAIGQGLQENVGIVVVVGLEAGEVFVDAVDADGKTPDPVTSRIDEVCRQKLAPLSIWPATLDELLAQKGQTHRELVVVRVQDDVVTVPAQGQNWATPLAVSHFSAMILEHRAASA